ncbi:MAG: hypothetical protein JXR51_09235 [Bacteroidales bacterium]|nr:hypothetical protein [Bacteroidales bacterium]MBN2757347.1 hypothetical protein [Bacteroidales bacterium]
MKKLQNYLLITVFLFSFFNFSAIAQDEGTGTDENSDFDIENSMGNQSSLSALLGYTDIGGEQFIGLRIQPELSIGKLGFGFDIPLMFNLSDGSLRTEEFKDGVGWARLIRYVRWGVKKKDPVYVRVGDLTGSYIGYGLLLDNYTNATSFEKRKVGLTFDVLVKNFIGVEGLYSDFDPVSTNLLAFRPYVKPLGMTDIPIAKTIDIGFTYVTDHDQTAIITEDADGNEIENKNEYIKDGMKAWSIDMGVIPLSNSFMQIRLYTQYGKLLKNSSELLQNDLNLIADGIRAEELATGVASDNPLVKGVTTGNAYDAGSGFSMGADFRFKVGGNVLRIDTRIERLWYKEFFMPQFFNATYEFSKDQQLLLLAQSNGKKGIYGALTLTVLDKIKVGGSLMIPDDVSETAPAILTLNLDASQLMEKVVITGQYVKGGLTGLSDAFELDDRSLLNARVAYKLYKFLMIGMDYKWTWSKLEDGTFHATQYVTPYIGFSMPLNIGGGNTSEPVDFGIDE